MSTARNSHFIPEVAIEMFLRASLHKIFLHKILLDCSLFMRSWILIVSISGMRKELKNKIIFNLLMSEGFKKIKKNMENSIMGPDAPFPGYGKK